MQKYTKISPLPQHIPIHKSTATWKRHKKWASWTFGFFILLVRRIKEHCISIVTSILSKQRNDPFLKKITTDDKKSLLWQCLTQEWISTAYTKGRSIGELLSKDTFRKNHAWENNGFSLVRSTPSTIFIRPCTKWFPIFIFSTECSEWPKNFLRIRWK